MNVHHIRTVDWQGSPESTKQSFLWGGPQYRCKLAWRCTGAVQTRRSPRLRARWCWILHSLSTRQLNFKLYAGKGSSEFILRIKIQFIGLRLEKRFLYSSSLNGNNLFPSAWDYQEKSQNKHMYLHPFFI